MILSFVIYEIFWYILFAATIYYALFYSVKDKKEEEKTIERKKAVVFIIPAIVWAFILEYSTQSIFQRYHYGSGFLIYISNVPLNVVFAWATLLFWSYWLVKKLKINGNIKTSLACTALPILCDLIFFEPLAYYLGYWTWTPTSVWFGSPIGNIVGWFSVIFLFIFTYNIIQNSIKKFKQQFFAALFAVIPNLIVLTIILKIWTALFGLI